MTEFATIFLALIFETTPFLLAGVAIAVVAGPWMERTLARAAFQQPALGLAAGASAGMVLPMCDCGSRPLAHRLAAAGRREFAIAFLLAAPVVNPIVIVTTWLAFRDVDLVVLRLGLTVLIAVVAALVINRVKGGITLPVRAGHEHAGEGWRAAPPRILSEFFELFQFLVVGAALAAAIQVFMERDALTSVQGIYLAVAAMMLLAFLLSICSSVDAFVIAGIGGALGTGPVLAFLTFGPLVNLKSMPMYLRLFSVPTVVLFSIIALQFSFVAAVGVELRGW